MHHKSWIDNKAKYRDAYVYNIMHTYVILHTYVVHYTFMYVNTI